ncbi:Anamorsin homolog [Seminavis robusta]|uniref:Anamorsin homolog n=1 Tax=Seminavis robusta TaxID=568900 RepID=A0A9N8DTH4_9STRA|nr:Anamorsin homolog [Seminavis robusta]|eukprot:Sro358_g125940.1 Anamorsin homolog (250) ;mRNA; r:55315-56152
MSQVRKFTVLLGSAANDPSTVSSGKAVAAATGADMKAARGDIGPSSLDHLDIVLNTNDLGLYDPMELASWAKCLQEGSTVSVSLLGDSNSSNLDAIHSSFLLAGLKGVSERREADGTRVFTANRPSAIKTSTGAKPLTKKQPAISVSLDDDDLIDEDILLTEDSALAPPPAMEATATAGDDCGGRTACDDCTCGRADKEAGEKKQQAKTSSCGKCGMGDAFRCASCPYLGMPAFKPGEEPVVLDLQDDF